MTERKPVMDDDKRKVLDLLEFISELCPSLRVCQIINNAVPPGILETRKRDTYYVSDSELAEWLQVYADNVLHLSAERYTEEQEDVE